MASEGARVRVAVIALAAAFLLAELLGWLSPLTVDYLPAPR